MRRLGFKSVRIAAAPLLAFVVLYSAVLFVQLHLATEGLVGVQQSPAEQADRSGTLSNVFGRSRKPHRAGAGELLQPLPGVDLAALPDTLSTLPPVTLPAASFTLATWLKPAGRRNWTTCLVSLGQTWALTLRPNGGLSMVVRWTPDTVMEHTSLLPAPVAAWTHVAVAAKGRSFNDISFYLNGTSALFSMGKSRVSDGPADPTTAHEPPHCALFMPSDVGMDSPGCFWRCEAAVCRLQAVQWEPC